METDDELVRRYLSLDTIPDPPAGTAPVIYTPPARRRPGRPKGSKNKPKPIDLILKREEPQSEAPPPPAPEPAQSVRHSKVKAPVTTLEGQIQWYKALLDNPDSTGREKLEAMQEIADLQGLKRVKDFGNMSAKSTEELHALLKEVLEIWKVAGILQVVDPGGEDAYLQN